MSKSFLVALLLALLLLGTVFFAVGYLSAFSFLDRGQKHETTCTNMSLWQQASQQHQAGKEAKGSSSGAKNPALQSFSGKLGAASGAATGLAAGVAGNVALNQRAQILGNTRSRYERTTDPLLQNYQGLSAGIRPFALQAHKQATHQVPHDLQQRSISLRSPFIKRHFGNVPAPSERTSFPRGRGYYNQHKAPFGPQQPPHFRPPQQRVLQPQNQPRGRQPHSYPPHPYPRQSQQLYGPQRPVYGPYGYNRPPQ